jgi:hypothetical protein
MRAKQWILWFFNWKSSVMTSSGVWNKAWVEVEVGQRWGSHHENEVDMVQDSLCKWPLRLLVQFDKPEGQTMSQSLSLNTQKLSESVG